MRLVISSCRNHLAAACLAGVILTAAMLPVIAAEEPLQNFVAHEAPKPVPPITFSDARGEVRNLADFKNKVIVLNLWATWCVSCRREMPALDRLQASLGGSDFMVLPLSIDQGGLQVVAKFYADTGIRDLPMYIDTSGKSLRELGAMGLPTTLILDRDGEEVARIVGPAEWGAPQVAEYLKPIIAKQGDPIKLAQSNDARSPGLLARVYRWLNTLRVN